MGRHDPLHRLRIRVDHRRAALIARRWPFLPRIPQLMQGAARAANVATSSSAIRTLAIPNYSRTQPVIRHRTLSEIHVPIASHPLSDECRAAVSRTSSVVNSDA
jgi:hypothetical protein